MTRIDDQTATTLATLARFSAALERRDVDGLTAEMTDDVVPESPGPAPDRERYEPAAAVASVRRLVMRVWRAVFTMRRIRSSSVGRS